MNQIQDWNLNIFGEIIDSMHMYQSYESGMKTHSAHLDEECRMEKMTLKLGDMEGVGVGISYPAGVRTEICGENPTRKTRHTSHFDMSWLNASDESGPV